MYKQLPIPSFFKASNAEKMYMIDYADIEKTAYEMRRQYNVPTYAADLKSDKIITAMWIDLQNTFTLPNGQLFVMGRSGRGAVDDNNRAAEFSYREAGRISRHVFTMDTHKRMQIFHPAMLINSQGEHPAPYTEIPVEDVEAGVWKMNPEVAASEFEGNIAELQAYLIYYVRELKRKRRYALTIWPYHGLLGGTSHAISAVMEEAAWYHNALRGSQTDFQIKGGKTLTENYSVIGPEVLKGPDGKAMFQRNVDFVATLQKSYRLIIGGQAKSHCLAWTVADFLDDINAKDPKLAKRVYLLEDCTSPVVVPGVVDHTDAANAAFQKFADAGMHIVKSTTPMDEWPDF